MQNVNRGLVGLELDHYLLEEHLGAGAMGEVYRASDQKLHRTVAIKVLAQHLANDKTFRERFQREMKISLGVEHPAVVPVYDQGIDKSHLYIVMRLVDGAPLDSLLADGRLASERAFRLFGHIAYGLDW